MHEDFYCKLILIEASEVSSIRGGNNQQSFKQFLQNVSNGM